MQLRLYIPCGQGQEDTASSNHYPYKLNFKTMTREDIRAEFIKRVNFFFDSNPEKSGGFDGMMNRLNRSEKFSEKILEILNDILDENNIDFKDDKEKEDFLVFMKSTSLELFKKIILN